ncbi:hypothetical protein [Aureisphaera sp.]
MKCTVLNENKSKVTSSILLEGIAHRSIPLGFIQNIGKCIITDQLEPKNTKAIALSNAYMTIHFSSNISPIDGGNNAVVEMGDGILLLRRSNYDNNKYEPYIMN